MLSKRTLGPCLAISAFAALICSGCNGNTPPPAPSAQQQAALASRPEAKVVMPSAAKQALIQKIEGDSRISEADKERIVAQMKAQGAQ